MRKLYGGMSSADGGGTRVRYDGDRMKCCPDCNLVYEEYYHMGRKQIVMQPLPEISSYKKVRKQCYRCDEKREDILEIA